MKSSSIDRTASYVLAACLGLGVSFWLFPISLIFVVHGVTPPFGDAAQHAAGQLAFIHDSWRWPPLQTTLLMPPQGVNIGLTDSIPILALLLKTMRSLLPEHFHGIYLWVALSWALQPIAAVFALRSMGARRWEFALAASVLVLCMPTFYHRDGHAALSAHFILMFAIGFYFRSCGGEGRILKLSSALTPFVFLVHPYLAAMYVGVLAATPITLFCRDNILWREALIYWIVGVVATAAIGFLFGYTGTISDGGFTSYSMNVLSPIYPGNSRLFAGWPPIDATGGQYYEGYQYFGAGILAVIFSATMLSVDRVRNIVNEYRLYGFVALSVTFIALMLKWFDGSFILWLDNSEQRRWYLVFSGVFGVFWFLAFVKGQAILIARRHAGLAIICVGLTLFAISTKMYVGNQLVLDLGEPHIFDQFRASGRFFWPVAYVCTLGSIAFLRLDRLLATAFLIVAAIAQVADTGGMRFALYQKYQSPNEWTVNAPVLRWLLAHSERLVIWPTFWCGARVELPLLEQVLLLGAEAGVPANTMRVSRRQVAAMCPSEETVLGPLQPGELRVFLPDGRSGAWQTIKDAARLCRPTGGIIICSPLFADEAATPIPTLPVGKMLLIARGQPGFPALDEGWSYEEWGASSRGYSADLVFNIENGVKGPFEFTVIAATFLPPWAQSATVSIAVNGGYVGVLALTRDLQELSLIIPAEAVPTRLMHVSFQFFLFSMSPKRMWMDSRSPGIVLHAFQLRVP